MIGCALGLGGDRLADDAFRKLRNAIKSEATMVDATAADEKCASPSCSSLKENMSIIGVRRLVSRIDI